MYNKDLKKDVSEILESNWRKEGYATPNINVYPYQWLWDSCFHSLIWNKLGKDDRAISELQRIFSVQSEDGFVPHINYEYNPDAYSDFWGRKGSSSITQPPMYGHVIAELLKKKVKVPQDIIESAKKGLLFLLQKRRRDLKSGLILLCHTWETGADNSPRWDSLLNGKFSIESWKEYKGVMVSAIEMNEYNSPVFNPKCNIASISFNALVAFNALELSEVTGDVILKEEADKLVELIDSRWDEELHTWFDSGVTSDASGRARTSEVLFALLVTKNKLAFNAAADDLFDEKAFGALFGPTGVHKSEKSFEPNTYWRGSTWPQVNYLLWTALVRNGRNEQAKIIADQTIRAVVNNKFSEHWNPITSEGLGARPQSWSGIALIMQKD